MLDLKVICEGPERIRKAIQVKRIELNLDPVLAADQTVVEIRKSCNPSQRKGMQMQRKSVKFH